MSVVTTELRFTRGGAPASQIERVANEVLAELRDPESEASASAERSGLVRADVAEVRVRAVESEQGVEPILTSIVVGMIGAVGARVAESLWVDVVWPRVRRRLGADALGERTPEGQES